LVDSDFDLPTRSDLENGMTDDSSRGLMGLADKLESSLRYASSDIDQSSLLAARLVEENTKVSPFH
jgi:hypothetical protein